MIRESRYMKVTLVNLLRAEQGAYDAILLDVDNGPEGLMRKENDNLYSPTGLKAALATPA